MAFKDRLREEIEFRGLLIKEVSAAAGISNNTFLSYIDARGTLPNVETAVKIAKVLGVSVEYLVTGEKDVARGPGSRDIQDIMQDLYQLDKQQISMLKKMVHSLTQD
ncbi:MAG: helix-turn-helix transcriptional regulator [Treponema sp.]|nr:helix-turn-helix transcriptional regulator [Treponema sp.]MBQ6566084.1 helix-turn-helix transcriptional regulator [Treponema sp.]